MSNLTAVPAFPLEELSSWANIAIVGDKTSSNCLRSKICEFFQTIENASIQEKAGKSSSQWEVDLEKALQKDTIKAEVKGTVILCPSLMANASLPESFAHHYRRALESLGTITCVREINQLSLNRWADYPMPYDLIFIRSTSQTRSLWYHFLRSLVSIEFCSKIVEQTLENGDSWLLVQYVTPSIINLFRIRSADLECAIEQAKTTAEKAAKLELKQQATKSWSISPWSWFN